MSKIFATLCGLLAVKHLTPTTYHSRINRHAERSTKQWFPDFETILQSINAIGIGLHSHSPTRTAPRCTGPPTPQHIASYRPSCFRDHQLFILAIPYRPTRTTKHQHKPCGYISNTASEPYVRKRTLICKKRKSGTSQIMTVASAIHRLSAQTTLYLPTDPIYRERSPT